MYFSFSIVPRALCTLWILDFFLLAAWTLSVNNILLQLCFKWHFICSKFLWLSFGFNYQIVIDGLVVLVIVFLN